MTLDENTPEFLVSVRLRNNRLLELQKETGLGPRELAGKVGISYAALLDLISLRLAPRNKKGEWRKPVRRLCDYFSVLPEDLFPEAVQQVKNAHLERPMGIGQIQQLMHSDPTMLPAPTPDIAAEASELARAVESALATLTPREEDVVRRRMGLTDSGRSETYREIGESYGLSVERVRQIEGKALRKMRHPARAKKLWPFVAGSSTPASRRWARREQEQLCREQREKNRQELLEWVSLQSGVPLDALKAAAEIWASGDLAQELSRLPRVSQQALARLHVYGPGDLHVRLWEALKKRHEDADLQEETP